MPAQPGPRRGTRGPLLARFFTRGRISTGYNLRSLKKEGHRRKCLSCILAVTLSFCGTMQCSALLDAARLGREIDDEMMTRWASDTLHTYSQSHPPSPFAHSIAAGERARGAATPFVRTPCRRVEQIVPSRDNLRGNSTENDGARGVR